MCPCLLYITTARSSCLPHSFLSFPRSNLSLSLDMLLSSLGKRILVGLWIWDQIYVRFSILYTTLPLHVVSWWIFLKTHFGFGLNSVWLCFVTVILVMFDVNFDLGGVCRENPNSGGLQTPPPPAGEPAGGLWCLNWA